MTTTSSAFALQIDWDERQRNEQKFNGSKHTDVCFRCGRPLTQKASDNGWWIQMTDSGVLVPKDYSEVDSQGCFPLGSECAKNVPTGLKFKFGA